MRSLTGKGIKYHRVDVERVRVVGRHKCRGSLDSITHIMLTGPGNVWISPRGPGLVHA